MATQPSLEARERLRDEAKTLDVEDIVDLCCTLKHDPLRVSIYLEALRTKSGEKAQLGACLLCFDLARHGDERAEAQLDLLLPVVEELTRRDDRGVVQALTGKHDNVLALWLELVEHAKNRDERQAPALAGDAEGGGFELALFDEGELDALDVDLGDPKAEAALFEFEAAFSKHWVATLPLFIAENGKDLDRVEDVARLARSFASEVPLAGELHMMSTLFLATHTRALGLFGRRNKKRDAFLRDSLYAFAQLDAPPEHGAAWFDYPCDVPNTVPHAWEKMAEVLLDFTGFVARLVDEGEDPTVLGFLGDAVERYLKDGRSARVPPVLAADDGKRRR